jgi:hypothetical protein
MVWSESDSAVYQFHWLFKIRSQRFRPGERFGPFSIVGPMERFADERLPDLDPF